MTNIGKDISKKDLRLAVASKEMRIERVFREVMGTKMMQFRRKETLFSQGDPSKKIMYILKGEVKISVVSKSGREAVVGIMGPGDFIGEGGLAGQSARMVWGVNIELLLRGSC
jgi:CRP-like cAMP-binding protein